jgi:potassium/hydrogen antiporter
VLIFVIVFTVLQAPTLPWVAGRLGLADRDQPTDVEVEVAPLERMSADLMQVKIPSGSKLNGVEIGELRLGKNAAVPLIIRDDQPMVPGPRDRMVVGDELLVVTPSHLRTRTENRLRAVARGGRLAGWRNPEVESRRPGRREPDE